MNPMFTAEAVLRRVWFLLQTIKILESCVYCGSGIETLIKSHFLPLMSNPVFTAEAVLIGLGQLKSHAKFAKFAKR